MTTISSSQPFAHVIDSHWANVGDNLKVRRALPAPQMNALGPWVFLDHFGPLSADPHGQGVPAHPHAGIETVTYLLEGGMAHRDSAGHEGRVEAGGVQWMTSGRGIVHAERPFSPEGNQEEFTLHGMQLWTSLPRALKMMPPRYKRINAADVPSAEKGGATIRVIAGESDGLMGPADALMPLFLWHVALKPGAEWRGQLPVSMEAGVYVMAGQISVDGDDATLRVGQLGIIGDHTDAGSRSISIRNPGDALAHVMLLGGAPVEGPLVFHGPFVMNSVEQIRFAEKAYVTGKMGMLAEI